MEKPVAVVFGGTGFLGRRVVRALVASDYRVRVAARNPSAADFSGVAADQVQFCTADVSNEQQVQQALNGATVAVNAVSLYVEKGSVTFEKIHVEGAARIARCAREANLKRLVHISGIGVNAQSASPFVRARARGEHAVRQEFPQVILVRPSVMCGCDDAFVASLQKVTRLPVVPLFGRGDMLLQPAYVEDVGAAVAQLATQGYGEKLFELGGSKVYSYREAVETVKNYLGRSALLVPVPFSLWHGLVKLMSLMPNPPLTSDQLILMQSDNVADQTFSGFMDLGITPRSLEDVLDQCLF